MEEAINHDFQSFWWTEFSPQHISNFDLLYLCIFWTNMVSYLCVEMLIFIDIWQNKSMTWALLIIWKLCTWQQVWCLEKLVDNKLAQDICSHCNGNSFAKDAAVEAISDHGRLLLRLCHFEPHRSWDWDCHWCYHSRSCCRLDLLHFNGHCHRSVHLCGYQPSDQQGVQAPVPFLLWYSIFQVLGCPCWGGSYECCDDLGLELDLFLLVFLFPYYFPSFVVYNM